ncbi:hypothetical protein B9T13_01950 [Wohlfahrtiimonas chitiniclastica]|nr:hypothetical protein B9T13_01950 [Wohlfahrtiimonas chitiniclastica]
MLIPVKKTPERSTIGVTKNEIIFLKDCCETIKKKTNNEYEISWSEFAKYVMMNYAEEAMQDIIFKIRDTENES